MITGFNPGLAANNIRQFAAEVEAAYQKLQSTIGDLTFGLADNWASPKAVKFKAEVKPLFDELFQQMNDESLRIQRGAYSAYNTAANAHGASTIADDSRGFFDATEFAELLEIKDGNVGMNIEVVRTTLLPAFETGMEAAADMVGSISTSIALYDTNEGQQRAYATGIASFKDKVLSILETSKKYLMEAIETEANTVFQGAQNAASNL